MKYFKSGVDNAIDWERVDMMALEMLEAARTAAGVPFVITSNYRTPEHSAEVGGTVTDAHTETPCTAFDIASGSATMEFKIIRGLILAGFTRIGIDKNYAHVHVDNSPNKPHEVFFIE